MSNKLVLFIGGTLFGIFAGYGIPNEGNLLLFFWDGVSRPLNYYFSPEHSTFLFLIGAIIAIIALFLILRPVIEAILAGAEGLVIFLAGLPCGLIFAFVVRIEYFVLGILILLVAFSSLRK